LKVRTRLDVRPGASGRELTEHSLKFDSVYTRSSSNEITSTGGNTMNRNGHDMKVQSVLFLLMLAVATLVSAEEPTVKDNEARLEASASWGVDLSSGRIAIDPSLVVYSDAASQTIVVHPKHVSEAAETLGAKELEDGSFEFPDGVVVDLDR
jgi:hypothetical protein